MIARLTASARRRWESYSRDRWFRRTFSNGRDLAASLRPGGPPCDRAELRGGGVALSHPPGRAGFARMLAEVWYDRVYTRDFYAPAPGDVVVDAGANVGLFSLLVARAEPDCRVYAFEPFAENYRHLVGNLFRSVGAMSPRVTPARAALAGATGPARLAAVGGRSQDHRLADDGEPVEALSLADALGRLPPGPVALFKCDIEGAERDLFASAGESDLARVERFAVEYHDNLRPGTLDILRARLAPTHRVTVRPEPLGYGMLYATRR